MESFLKACHDAVKDAETKKLAALMNMPHVSLLQRSNSENDAHWFNVKHLYALLLHSGDMRPLAALADEFGYSIIKVEQPAAIGVHPALSKVSLEISELTVETHNAMDDGRIDQIERARILREIDHAEQALAQLKASVKAA
jgi:hypothetical protein